MNTASILDNRRDARSYRAVAAGVRLTIDALTEEIFEALHERGIDPILLKGPAVASWLYDPPSARSYNDLDLMVAADRVSATVSVLEAFGFSAADELLPGNRPWVARAFARDDGATVDLHRALVGVRVAPSRCWEILRSHTATLSWRGRTFRSLDEIGRTLHVALHAAQHGAASATAREDLGRALDLVSFTTWAKAAGLARELDASGAFATGLRLLPNGSEMAHRLGVVDDRSVDSQLTADALPDLTRSFALGFEWLSTRRGLVAKTGYVIRKLLPPPQWLRAWTPIARRGPIGLALGYLWRWTWLGLHVYPGYRAWIEARRRLDGPD